MLIQLLGLLGLVMTGPPRIQLTPPTPVAHDRLERPASCETIYDAELGQMDPIIGTDPVANLNSTLRSNTLYDFLVVDDFLAERAGRITDIFTYSNLLTHYSEPADGVRVYLWGTGEVPAEDPTLVLEVPLNQIRLRYIRTLGADMFLEIHVPNLDIPFQPGRTWFTVQPRDETPGQGGYYWICRNANRPVQGADAYIKDGPNGQGGWGFTEWRSAGSQGLDAADSYVRIEGCFDPISISVEGECGGPAQFSWSNTPPGGS